MSASQNAPTVKVTERELAVTLVGLYAEFMRTESAPFRNAQSDEDPEMATFMQELSDTIDFEVKMLMASRLATNNRKVPLLATTDAHRVAANMLEGNQMNDETASSMALITPLARFSIEGTLVFLRAIDADPYVAFWRLMTALSNEAVDSGKTPLQAATSPESRASVYRSLMSYPTWRKLTAARVAMTSGVSLSSLVGGAMSFMDDDAASNLNEGLAAIDAELAPRLAEVVEQRRQYYTELGQSIWPVGARR